MLFSQHGKLSARLVAVSATIVTMLFSGLAQADYRLNFQDPVTGVAREIYDLHMLIFWICVAIFVGVFGVMFYSIFKHRKSKNFTPSTFSHSTSVEIIWTIIPFLILVGMAVPATRVLIKMEDTTKSDLTIKITGYQWKWGYEYMDGSDISFYSTLSTPRTEIDQFNKETATEINENYLLETDKALIVPAGRKVRALITANDVIHAWWIPAFGTKKDAIPGYINELWFNVDEDKTGVYRGNCAELCGKDHAYMPIVVEVLSADDFDKWVAAGGEFNAKGFAKLDGKAVEQVAETPSVDSSEEKESSFAESVIEAVVPAAEAADEGATLSMDELLTKGESVYNSQCAACHMADGAGLPGVFPAITASALVVGPLDAHLDIVMNGKPGTAMAAFGRQLDDEEIAAVLTYQRNALGNSVGDSVQAADIAENR
ncbi:hypothetical protein NBRC116583_31250 [Arenicella sp. 4NH20-0111]